MATQRESKAAARREGKEMAQRAREDAARRKKPPQRNRDEMISDAMMQFGHLGAALQVLEWVLDARVSEYDTDHLEQCDFDEGVRFIIERLADYSIASRLNLDEGRRELLQVARRHGSDKEGT